MEEMKGSSSEKVKVTVMLDRTLKKFAQMYALENDISLTELIEKSLRSILTK